MVYLTFNVLLLSTKEGNWNLALFNQINFLFPLLVKMASWILKPLCEVNYSYPLLKDAFKKWRKIILSS